MLKMQVVSMSTVSTSCLATDLLLKLKNTPTNVTCSIFLNFNNECTDTNTIRFTPLQTPHTAPAAQTTF